MTKKKKDRMQSVIITFDDGTIATFSGPAFAEEGDTRTITDLKFTTPVDLPDDCEFETLDNVKTKI